MNFEQLNTQTIKRNYNFQQIHILGENILVKSLEHFHNFQKKK